MSITFWCPDAPKTVQRMEDGDGDFAMEVSTLPEVQMSNSSAHHLMMLLNIEQDNCGTIQLDKLHELEATILRMVQSLDLYHTPGSESHGLYIRRMMHLYKLVVLARHNKFNITWG